MKRMKSALLALTIAVATTSNPAYLHAQDADALVHPSP
jgi:hypothetical protein